MGYSPENNPYIPGDPYSYDLAWMVEEVKKAQQVGENAQASADAAAQSALDAAGSRDAAALSAGTAANSENNADLSAIAANASAETAANLVDPLDTRMDVLESRMDGFTNLPAASTAGDAELQDIRIGYNGATYPTAGDAVRGQITDIHTDLNRLDLEFINLFDYANRINGYQYKSTQSLAGMNELAMRQASPNNFCSGLIPVKANTSYCMRVVSNGNLKIMGTGYRFIQYDSTGEPFTNVWVTDAGTVTTSATAAYCSFSSANNVYDVSKLMFFKTSDILDKYYPHEFYDAHKWEQRISSLEGWDHAIKEKCKLIEAPGYKFDVYKNATAISNCTVAPSGLKKFADNESALVTFNSAGDAVLEIDVSAGDKWDSLTLVFYNPDNLGFGDTNGIRIKLGFNTQGTQHLGYYYISNKFGWNFLKIPRASFTNAPARIQKLYIYGYAGTNVPANTDYCTLYFDSVIIDMRMKPTVILNFDHWWADSITNGGYQYAFDNDIPFTMMTKNYATLAPAFLNIAKEAFSMHGCENGYYGSYGASNTVFQNLADYSVGIANAENMKNEFYNAMPNEKFISYGCSQMKVNPLGLKALEDAGIPLIRGQNQGGFDIGYFDKNEHLISSKGISYSDVSDIATLQSMVDSLIAHGSVGLFFTHGICNDTDTTVGSSSAIRITTFKALIDYLVAKRTAGQLQIITMRDFWNML